MPSPPSPSSSMPPSRYSKLGVPGGVITNGGFDTTRSKSSPSTGSSKEPSRRSHAAGGALRRRLKSAKERARREMSVATTSRAWTEACSAWIPEPVPRSRTRPTGVRIVTDAKVVVAPPMPSTWSPSS